MTECSAIKKAVEIAGGQSALARKIGGKTRQQHVFNWLRAGRVSAEQAIAIERATDGQVSRIELRPDIFETPADGGSDPSPSTRSSAEAAA